MCWQLDRATPADVAAIRECYLRSWRAAYEPELPPDRLAAELERRRAFDWSSAVTADRVVVMLARDDAGVAGVVEATLDLDAPRDLPEITMLYVDPRAWGTGVASGLLRAGCGWMLAQGHASARLRVVETHARARRFYEREGWTLDPLMEPATNGLHRLLYYRAGLAPTS